MIYKCGGIDKRTIEKFEKVSLTLEHTALSYHGNFSLPHQNTPPHRYQR